MGGVDYTQLLQKQRYAIQILRRDNANFSEELRLLNNHSVLPTTITGHHLVDQLQDECDILTRKIGLKKSILADTQDKCSSLTKKVEEQKLSMGGITAAAKQSTKASRSVKQQENRLQAVLQHRNEALASTGDLRGRIEGLRRESLACREVLQKAQATLRTDQRSLISLLTESAAAAEQKEAVLGEITSLQTKLGRFTANSEAEWSQLSHIIQQDRQARENARQEDISERERRTQALVKAEIGTQRRASAATLGMTRNKAAQDATAVCMARLTSDFEAVKAATGVEDLSALAEQMTAAEETKHRLFSFVGELNAELEAMDTQISLLQQEMQASSQAIGARQAQQDERREGQRSELHAAVQEAEMFEARAGRALLQLNAIRKAVAELFEAADCPLQAVRDVLGSDGINTSNLMQCLGIVEQSVDQTLREFTRMALDPLIPQKDQQQIGKGTLRVRHEANAIAKGSAENTMLLLEPPSVPVPQAKEADTPIKDEELDILLDAKALMATAEQSLRRRMEEGKMGKSGAMTGTRHTKTLRK